MLEFLRRIFEPAPPRRELRQCACGIGAAHSPAIADCVANAKANGYKTTGMGFIIDKRDKKRFFDGAEWLRL